MSDLARVGWLAGICGIRVLIMFSGWAVISASSGWKLAFALIMGVGLWGLHDSIVFDYDSRCATENAKDRAREAMER